MFKRVIFAGMIAVLLLSAALPALAAQGGIGGVHFGPYTLNAGDSVTGDLVVFGPVTLGRDSNLSGNLAAFGAVTMRENARVRGNLAVFGAADVAGIVEGDVFAAGELRLRGTARVEGDVSSAGAVVRDPGAVVEGEIQHVEGVRGFSWNFPFGPITPGDDSQPPMIQVRPSRPVWLNVLWKLVRGFLTIVVLGLFALLVTSLWPRHVERVAETIVNVPLPSFGVGLLAAIGVGALLFILTVTICLSPLALIGAVIAGLGMVLGWVALGSVLGDRVLRGIFRAEQATPVAAAVLGTVLITVLAVLVHLAWDCLYAILIWPLFALAAGAVVLTQFGTTPYASTGAVRSPVAPAAPPRRPVTPARPVAPRVETPVEPALPEVDALPSPYGEDEA